jgi:hypothetical protein
LEASAWQAHPGFLHFILRSAPVWLDKEWGSAVPLPVLPTASGNRSCDRRGSASIAVFQSGEERQQKGVTQAPCLSKGHLVKRRFVSQSQGVAHAHNLDSGLQKYVALACQAARRLATVATRAAPVVQPPMQTFTIDGQAFPMKPSATFDKFGGKWRLGSSAPALRKTHGLQGPIDDAFMDAFLCVRSASAAAPSAVNDFAVGQLDRFAKEFPRWMRGISE